MNYLRFCTINTQSLNKKTTEFTDFICDYKPDVAITETWFHVNESAARVMCTPTGYNLLDHPRVGRRGGGTGIMFRDNLSVCQCTASEFQSFEYSEWKVTSGTQHIHMIIIYRPPYSEAHPTTTSVFLEEFSQYLESAVLCTDQLLISRDFNIHVDVTDDSDAHRFRGLLDSIGLDQCVKVSTHISGPTLDLIITRNSDQLLVSAPWADHLFSDHIPVHCNIQVEKPSFKKSQISYMKLKSMNMEALRNDLSKSDFCNNTLSLELNDLVSCYNKTLTSTLDRHAPLITKSVTKRPVVPWFSQEIKSAKKERCHAERKWRRTKLDCDFRIYKAKKNVLIQLMRYILVVQRLLVLTSSTFLPKKKSAP